MSEPGLRMGRGWVWAALAAAAVIGAATLHPSSGQPAPATCLFCGERWLADAIANIILFMPLGAALSLGRVPVTRIILTGCLFSGLIESTQIAIPGRDANLTDVIVNTTGAWAGAVVFGALPRLIHPRSAFLVTVPPALPTVLVLLTGFLTRPSNPEGTLYGQWTPNLAHFAWYRGRVVDATLGGSGIRGERLDDQEEVKRALVRGDPLRVVAVAGPAPARQATLFAIANDRGSHILRLAPDRNDLVVFRQLVAARLGLDEPYVRFVAALSRVTPGDTLRIATRLTEDGIALSMGPGQTRVHGLTVGDGWMLLYSAPGRSALARTLISALWMIGLFLPAGYAARRNAWAWWGVAAGGTALLLTPALTWMAAIPPGHWAAAGLGMLIGYVSAGFRLPTTPLSRPRLEAREQRRHQ